MLSIQSTVLFRVSLGAVIRLHLSLMMCCLNCDGLLNFWSYPRLCKLNLGLMEDPDYLFPILWMQHLLNAERSEAVEWKDNRRASCHSPALAFEEANVS